MKLIQINIVHFDPTDTNELVDQIFQNTFATDNLPVNAFAGVSGDSAEDNHQRFLV